MSNRHYQERKCSFNLPDNEDSAIWGITNPIYRGKHLDSLPNITGNVNAWTYAGSAKQPNGCFYQGSVNDETYTAGIQHNGMTISFDASRSSNVYGRNGNTSRVYPARTAYIAVIKY